MNKRFLTTLGESIANEQDAAFSEQDFLSDQSRFVADASTSTLRSRPRLLLWPALAAAALVGAVVWVAIEQKPRPVRFAIKWQAPASISQGSTGAWVSAPESAAVPIQFSEGTRVTLAAGARARIARSDTESVNIMVERGHLAFNVAHHDGTRWSIATGPFAVTVTGTEFDLDWRPESESLELAVRKGAVVVTGCQFSHGRDVRANEMLRTRCGDTLSVTTTERALLGDSGAQTANVAETSPEIVNVGPERVMRETATSMLSATAAKWQTLAQKGQYRGAYAVVDQFGFEPTCAKASATELALLMDVARYAGKNGRAEYAAKLLRSRFMGQPQAALAAFTLGRLAFDQASDYGSAARWFMTYLKEQPGGALAREAEGRLMECLSHSGQVGDARQVAARYLTRYPEGPHARLAHTLLGSDR